MGMTAIEKILARAAQVDKVIPGESLECKTDLVATHDLQGKLVFATLKSLGITKIPDPERFVIVLDHQSPANSIPLAEIHKSIREMAKDFGVKHLYDIGSGILHIVLPEEGFILPGELVVMNESHTPTGGALGAAVIGVGQTDVAVAIATGSIWLVVPETIKLNFIRNLKYRVSAKDIGLKLMSLLGYEDKAIYKAIEIGGDISSIGMDGRFTLTNFCSDMGAKSAFIEPDAVTADFLRNRARRSYTPVYSDPDCLYAQSFDIDLEALEPLIACPHSLDNIKHVSAVAGIPINQAVLGTCTNGRLDDIKV
jgi:3-isopropylmalate/(R)-2-methylmalate dehydratase large subunit